MKKEQTLAQEKLSEVMKTEQTLAQEKLSEARKYLEKLKLTEKADEFMGRDDVRKTIRDSYARLEEVLNSEIEGMEVRRQRIAKRIYSTLIEEDFSFDVKANLLCNVTRAIKIMEEFAPVDENMSLFWNNAFTNEADGKLLEMIKIICRGMSNSLIREFLDTVEILSSIPRTLAEDAMDEFFVKAPATVIDFEKYTKV